MPMFKKQIRIFGKHAEIMQKYCRDKGTEQDIPFIITENGENKKNYIFETRIGIYMVAAMLGIVNKKSVLPDKSSDASATIMVEIIDKQRENLMRIYQHMILSEESITSTDAKIKKAFSIDMSDEECEEAEKHIEDYVRGGLEIIDDIFRNCKSYEDICNSIIELNSQISID